MLDWLISNDLHIGRKPRKLLSEIEKKIEINEKYCKGYLSAFASVSPCVCVCV